jgi:hypothetical protein
MGFTWKYLKNNIYLIYIEFMKYNLLQNIFQVSLLIALLISFYIFVRTLVMKDLKNSISFSTWQFPMLLAIYIEAIYD